MDAEDFLLRPEGLLRWQAYHAASAVGRHCSACALRATPPTAHRRPDSRKPRSVRSIQALLILALPCAVRVHFAGHPAVCGTHLRIRRVTRHLGGDVVPHRQVLDYGHECALRALNLRHRHGAAKALWIESCRWLTERHLGHLRQQWQADGEQKHRCAPRGMVHAPTSGLIKFPGTDHPTQLLDPRIPSRSTRALTGRNASNVCVLLRSFAEF